MQQLNSSSISECVQATAGQLALFASNQRTLQTVRAISDTLYIDVTYNSETPYNYENSCDYVDKLATIQADLFLHLDNNKIIPHELSQRVRVVNKQLGQNKTDIYKFFGIEYRPPRAPSYNAYTASYVKLLAARSLSSRKSFHRANLAYEVELARKRGWYTVFNTLTVRNETLLEVFKPGSKSFTRYIRRYQDSIARALGFKVKYVRDNASDFHRYLACVELGTEHNRPHIHVLHFSLVLPYSSSDPNTYSSVPVNRQITAIWQLWPYGHSHPIAVRQGKDDAFSRAGWLWPVFEMLPGNYQPLPAEGTQAICGYVVKYITKSYERETSWQTDEQQTTNLWRVRMTRNLGRMECRRSFQQLSPKTVLRFLQENKARRLPRHLAVRHLPPMRSLRSAAMHYLSRRRLLDRLFLRLTPQLSLFSRGSMRPKSLERLRFPHPSFGVSKQVRIDQALSKVLDCVATACSISTDRPVLAIAASVLKMA